MQYYKSWQDDRILYQFNSSKGHIFTLVECCSRGNLSVSILILCWLAIYSITESQWGIIHLVCSLFSSSSGSFDSNWCVGARVPPFTGGRSSGYKTGKYSLHRDWAYSIGWFGLCISQKWNLLIHGLAVYGDWRLDGWNHSCAGYLQVGHVRLFPCSLGLVVYQLMSKEELPISGDRWSELRKGGVFVDGLIDD